MLTVTEQLRDRVEVRNSPHKIQPSVPKTLGQCGNTAELTHRDASVHSVIQ